MYPFHKQELEKLNMPSLQFRRNTQTFLRCLLCRNAFLI